MFGPVRQENTHLCVLDVEANSTGNITGEDGDPRRTFIDL
jgi:hypothetical protein